MLIRVLADNRDLHTPRGPHRRRVARGRGPAHRARARDDAGRLRRAVRATRASPCSLGACRWSRSRVLTALILVGGRRVVPWLLTRIAATRSRELFTLTVLVLALGIAVASAQLFGVSMALGAFLAGMVVGRSEFSVRAASEALPMRDAFAVLFFVSVGMLLDPGVRAERPAAHPRGARGRAHRQAARGAGARARCGATRRASRFGRRRPGADRRVLVHRRGRRRAARVWSLTMSGTRSSRRRSCRSPSIPLLYRAVAPLERWMPQRRSGGRDGCTRRPSRPAPPTATRGTARSSSATAPSVERSRGCCARTTSRRRSSISTSTPCARCATKGLPAIYGDAGHRDTLVSAGVPTAGAIILSVAGLPRPRRSSARPAS